MAKAHTRRLRSGKVVNVKASFSSSPNRPPGKFDPYPTKAANLRVGDTIRNSRGRLSTVAKIERTALTGAERLRGDESLVHVTMASGHVFTARPHEIGFIDRRK